MSGLVLDLDATLVTCSSEKEQAAAACKHGFGFHPLPCFLDRGPRHVLWASARLGQGRSVCDCGEVTTE